MKNLVLVKGKKGRYEMRCEGVTLKQVYAFMLITSPKTLDIMLEEAQKAHAKKQYVG